MYPLTGPASPPTKGSLRSPSPCYGPYVGACSLTPSLSHQARGEGWQWEGGGGRRRLPGPGRTSTPLPRAARRGSAARPAALLVPGGGSGSVLTTVRWGTSGSLPVGPPGHGAHSAVGSFSKSKGSTARQQEPGRGGQNPTRCRHRSPEAWPQGRLRRDPSSASSRQPGTEPAQGCDCRIRPVLEKQVESPWAVGYGRGGPIPTDPWEHLLSSTPWTARQDHPLADRVGRGPSLRRQRSVCPAPQPTHVTKPAGTSAQTRRPRPRPNGQVLTKEYKSRSVISPWTAPSPRPSPPTTATTPGRPGASCPVLQEAPLTQTAHVEGKLPGTHSLAASHVGAGGAEAPRQSPAGRQQETPTICSHCPAGTALAKPTWRPTGKGTPGGVQRVALRSLGEKGSGWEQKENRVSPKTAPVLTPTGPGAVRTLLDCFSVFSTIIPPT